MRLAAAVVLFNWLWHTNQLPCPLGSARLCPHCLELSHGPAVFITFAFAFWNECSTKGLHGRKVFMNGITAEQSAALCRRT